MAERLRPVLLACLALLAALSCGGDERDPAAAQVQVLVVPIEGLISAPTVALVRRALREARSTGISRVVLEIDTLGGYVDSMREVEGLLAGIREENVDTVAYVLPNREAISAGAYIALACRQTFMGPGSTIGAITPVVAGLEGVTEIPDDDARMKAYAAMRADVRALLEQRGNYSEDALRIVEAMVDPGMMLYHVRYDDNGMDREAILEIDELRAWEKQPVRIFTTEPVSTSHPIVLTAREADQYQLISGVVDSLQVLVRDHFHLSMSSVHRMKMSWSENAVSWIDGLKPFLFLFGFILLIVELKTPGFAVPGVLGVLLLGLGMFGSYLVGLAELTEILLFFLGIAALGVEIFVLPGTIIFGALGFICVVASLILSQQTFILPNTLTQEDILLTNLINMLLLIICVIVAGSVLRKFLPQIPILNRVILNPPERHFTGDSTRFAEAGRGSRLKDLVGRVGVAETILRPSGILELDGDRMDVVTAGDFIEAGAKIRVVRVDGNRIVVEEAGEGGDA